MTIEAYCLTFDLYYFGDDHIETGYVIDGSCWLYGNLHESTVTIMKKSDNDEKMTVAKPDIIKGGFVLVDEWLDIDILERAEAEGLNVDKIREEARRLLSEESEIYSE